VESTASWCCSKSMDTIPTTTSPSWIEAKEYWYRIEYLLFKLGAMNDDPNDAYKRLPRLSAFADAVKRHTGITNPYFMWGKAYDYHEF